MYLKGTQDRERVTLAWRVDGWRARGGRGVTPRNDPPRCRRPEDDGDRNADHPRPTDRGGATGTAMATARTTATETTEGERTPRWRCCLPHRGRLRRRQMHRRRRRPHCRRHRCRSPNTAGTTRTIGVVVRGRCRPRGGYGERQRWRGERRRGFRFASAAAKAAGSVG